VTIRRATEADEALLRELWEEFEREVPWEIEEPETWDDEWADVRDDMRDGGVFLAEDGEGPVGMARVEAPVRGRAHVQVVYVRERARRQGVATDLLRSCVEDARARGARFVSLDVLESNERARTVWGRLGFEVSELLLAAPIERLEQRLAGPSKHVRRATTHLQSDDRTSLERAIDRFIPRLEQPDLRANGSWIRISDAVLDRDREAHGRFARELSERLGTVTVALAQEGEVVRFRLYERGRMVDEYLSVPNYYGPLSKGDELALEANPTLVARLTGADRDEVRRLARTASTPAELPPAAELYEQLAGLMGLEP
jgi:ribosomal protein S18 acetylase RimI-like enzyme